MTQRQLKTAAAYLFSERRYRPSQKEVGQAFGIKQPAVSKRLKRFVSALSADQRDRYLRIAKSSRKKTRVALLQINFADNI